MHKEDGNSEARRIPHGCGEDLSDFSFPNFHLWTESHHFLGKLIFLQERMEYYLVLGPKPNNGS